MLCATSRTWRSCLLRHAGHHSKLWKSTNPYWQSLHTPSVLNPLLRLPQSCPGCGAYSHFDAGLEAGRYSLTRKSIRSYVEGFEATDREDGDPTQLAPQAQNQLHPSNSDSRQKVEPLLPPVCDRCHNLVYHSTGASVEYPSIKAIEHMLFESPYKQNHIYHILDAADFPLSLIEGIQRHLSLSPQRSRNRRSNAQHYTRDQRREISFIIARSDLLAPEKAQVDRLMPYLVRVLRNALAGSGPNIRLGNVHCVSAQRGWWTKQLKEKIWQRGGAGWFVGKANVGKSSLLDCVFPKGRMSAMVSMAQDSQNETPYLDAPLPANAEIQSQAIRAPRVGTHAELDREGTLPPAAVERDYPVLPVVSHIQGTTAAPIRLPFGGGKGELIDLPGIRRTSFAESSMGGEGTRSLIMRSRVNPLQHSIKPGESLLVADLVVITPVFPLETFLAFPFVPLHSKVVSSSRKVSTSDVTSEDFLDQNSTNKIDADLARSAHCLRLEWDVTRQRLGRLADRKAAGANEHNLPFRIFSADILLEGIGWIELVAQVRARHFEADPQHPQISIRSPKGLRIEIREPMNASLLTRRHAEARRVLKSRPRRSLRGTKKLAKSRSRASLT